MKKFFRFIAKILLLLFFALALLLFGGFWAVRFGWTDVSGEEDLNSFEYNKQAEENRKMIEDLQESMTLTASSTDAILTIATTSMSSLPDSESIDDIRKKINWCKISIAQESNSQAALSIFEAYHKTHSEILLNNMLLALKLRLTDKIEFEKKINICQNEEISVTSDDIVEKFLTASSSNLYTWQNGEPWQIIRGAIIRDKDLIYQVAEKVGIQPRLLLSVAIVEQLRLYYTQRELFEKVFKPLQILANANKMAWGVMAIKEKMAMETEDHLHDASSPYYLGEDYASLLDFPSYEDEAEKQKNKERYRRLTDKKTHYYSYLYGALILKQFQTQWESAGYPLRYRPEILATLFNIGFNHSSPKANPKVGGSTIEIDEEKYYFGSLAFEFYYSGELSDEFPFE